MHDAESAVALGQWTRAWIASHIAMNVAGRPLLPRVERPWLEERRAWLAEVRLRALEALAASGLELGGPELVTCRRAAGELIASEPFRESGHRLLMQALEREGNTAQALVVFERLRTQLRGQLRHGSRRRDAGAPRAAALGHFVLTPTPRQRPATQDRQHPGR